MSRVQAQNTLDLLSEAVADLPDDPWDHEEWRNVASIVESFEEVPLSLQVSSMRMHTEISRRLCAQQPQLSGKVLSKLIATYSAGTQADPHAVRALLDSVAGRYEKEGAHTMSEIAESLSHKPDVWGTDVKKIVSWALETQEISNEVCWYLIKVLLEHTLSSLTSLFSNQAI